jgi:hypothetical protein
MGYTLEQLEQGILAAKEQGNEQAVRALGTEYLRLAEEQNQASAPAITQAREDNGFLGNVSRGATQYGSGFNEGLANFSGMPVDGMTWILNKGIDGLNALAGTDLSQIKDPFGGSDSIKSGLTSAGTIAPPDPEFATTRKVGNYTGEGVSMALTGPLLRLPGVAGDLFEDRPKRRQRWRRHGASGLHRRERGREIACWRDRSVSRFCLGWRHRSGARRRRGRLCSREPRF